MILVTEQSSDISDGEYQVGDNIESDEDDMDMESKGDNLFEGKQSGNALWNKEIDNNVFLFDNDQTNFDDLFL